MGTGCSTGKGTAGLGDEIPHLKIAIVGDPGVGKTSVLLRYIRNQFSPMYVPTKKVAIENVVRKLNVPSHTIVSLTLWDIPGREDMDVHKSYFRNLDAAIVVVDMSDERCIAMATVWKQTLLNKITRTVEQAADNNQNSEEMMKEVPIDAVKFPVLLLGNKYDLIEQEVMQSLEQQMATQGSDWSPADSEGKHPRVQQLEEMAEKHGFVGSVMVASNKAENSVAMAIQALVRSVLERDKNIPRKFRLVKKEETKQKEDKKYYYDKLVMTGVAKFDEIFLKADILVKKVSMLRHYLTVSFVRLKEVCLNGNIVQKEATSLEDCIVGLKNGVATGTSLQIAEDEGFYRLVVIDSNEDEDGEEKTKQTHAWQSAYRCFHNEYAAICKTVLRDCPPLESALEKYDIAMSRMSEDAIEPSANGKPLDLEKVSNMIVYNRAKCQHAKLESRKCVETVEKAGRRISAAHHW